MTSALVAGIALSVTLSLETPARGDLLLDISNGHMGRVSGPHNVLGYTFTTSNSLEIGAVGLMNAVGGGLFSSHQVGIWDSNGNLVTSTTVPAGTGSFTVPSTQTNTSGIGGSPQWIFESLATPVILVPGTYVIGATMGEGGGDQIFAEASVHPMPGVTYDGTNAISTSSDILTEPPPVGLPNSFFGPNLSVVPVPEPASWLLMATGMLGLVGWSRWKRRRDSTPA